MRYNRYKFLLGANTDNELVFGEFEVTNRNGYNEFAASFFTVRPFNGNNADLEDYYENLLYSYDKETLYDLCVGYDCKPSDIAENMASKCDDVRDVIDCSLYPECYTVDGNDWYFESCSCGQHDTRNEMEEIINPEAYNLLNELWDKYHLKEVNDETISCVENLAMTLAEVDEEEWIEKFIQNHIDELD